MTVYFNGTFLAKQDVRISPDDRGFLFGDGVYEVVAAYCGRLFQADAHFVRMARSLRELRLAGPDSAELMRISERLIADNDLGACNAKVYIQVTRGAAARRHAFPPPETPATVYACASSFDRPERTCAEGVEVILVPDNRWARCDIKSVALLPNVLAAQRAHDRGVEEAVFVRDGALTEGSHTNFCGVFGGELVTAPKSNYILPGITRQVALGLCADLGIAVREFPILEADLAHANELMLLGTTAEVTPVVRVDGRAVHDGKPGPITRRLQAAFRKCTV